MVKCSFVDPEYNHPCNKKASQKIVIQWPNKNQPLVKFACERHGDARFNYLSLSEKKLQKKKDENKIEWQEYKDEIRLIRWKICRRCNGDFEEQDMQCCVEYFWITDIRIGLKRSFLLHNDCLSSELRYYEINRQGTARDTTLDPMLI